MPRKVLVAQCDCTFDLIEAPAENEHHLQEVMKNSPTLLPVDDLGITGPLLVVGRESSVASGIIDLVGAVPSGDLILVEFKTGPQNPDFRHALAQLGSMNGARWLTWKVFSNPSAVLARSPKMPPALLGGSIINLTSQGATNPPLYSAVYSSTKGAINSLTLELARELGPRGIRVNALASGATVTEGAADLGLTEGSEFAGQFVAQTPLGRLGRPEDLAKATVFLASDESQWVTGDVIKASGGMI